MARKAIIDIGSNSIKFYVGELGADGTVHTVIDTNDVTRMGEGLGRTGVISPKVMERNALSVARFKAMSDEAGADETVAVGTMALRSASNSAEFVDMVRRLCGIEVKIIPGEEEARLSYLAAVTGLKLKDGEAVVFDTGGGSTEFIFGIGSEIKKRFSINVGAVRVTESYLGQNRATKEDVEAARAEINREFAEGGVDGHPVQVVGIGGTVTNMGAVKHRMAAYDPDIIQGSILTAEDIKAQILEYSALTIDERRSIPGLNPKRADVILGGACIVDVILERLGAKELTISDRGLRHGLAAELFQGRRLP